jgi:hemerythrin superfamily protein
MATRTETRDIVDVVLDDHQQIRALFTEFETARPDERDDLWQVIVRTLAVHETAEEEIVHPKARRHVDGGDDIVDERVAEEDTAKKELADLEKLGPGAPGFDERFTAFRRAVLEHAAREEAEELPELRLAVDPGDRRRMASLFMTAEGMAPTHGHKLAPESAVGNMVMGPMVAIVDRARDAIRDAMAKSSG